MLRDFFLLYNYKLQCRKDPELVASRLLPYDPLALFSCIGFSFYLVPKRLLQFQMSHAEPNL